MCVVVSKHSMFRAFSIGSKGYFKGGKGTIARRCEHRADGGNDRDCCVCYSDGGGGDDDDDQYVHTTCVPDS